ncbi:2,3-diaminopropionate biosynthesis protein SbnB [Rhodococcus sp. NPDC060176]|uniref:2,3-diaminopropionate biosynthesis protein SbnB n=1 Tax=Rhodococcus sp. NPDC060176 TaxID=3347062 RepID=UPI0036485D91
MSDSSAPKPFVVISGEIVDDAMQGHEGSLLDLVKRGYILHGEGKTVNPPSYFLRFPDDPRNRIIALPSAVGGDVDVSGIKWISSYPNNVDSGIPRASAVVILNDSKNGYPLACLEGSIISAVRTAASAAIAASLLSENRPKIARLGIVGTGLIARYVYKYLVAAGIDPDEVALYDKDDVHSNGLARHLFRERESIEVTVHESIEDVIRSSDLVIFATTAGSPYVTDVDWFSHKPLVLHISLRDLSPTIIFDSCNIVDDVEHCLKAETSVHLAEQASRNRDHVHATLYSVITGSFAPPSDRTVVFSPFGLGVLDLVVAKFIYNQAIRSNTALVVESFFHDLSRHGGR